MDSSDVRLEEGENLLCIQGLNVSLSSSDFYFDMGISASLSLPEVSDSLKITFDREAGFYDSLLTSYCQTDETGYNIVYTLDGSNPQTSASAEFKRLHLPQFQLTLKALPEGQKHRSSSCGPPWRQDGFCTIQTGDKVIHFS